ncbi:MAG: sugar kinase [Cellvibrionaceae bacterium]
MTSQKDNSVKTTKVVLITRRTRMEELIAQYNTEAQAEFVVNSRGDDFAEYRLEHVHYYESINAVKESLQRLARVQEVERGFLPNFMFGPQDIVVVVGQDGLVANTLKYLSGQPVIAINPEPTRYDGILLPFQVKDTTQILNDVIKKAFNRQHITMAKATLNDGQELLAVNDFFIGPRFQTSARYELNVGGRSEVQSSSGIIISTGLGSTGWMKSIIAGARGVVGSKDINAFSMAWDDDFLQYAVREPFPSQTTGVELVFGKIDQENPMSIASRMPNNGVIFSDGMVEDVVEFISGTVVSLTTAKDVGILVV